MFWATTTIGFVLACLILAAIVIVPIGIIWTIVWCLTDGL